METEMSKSGSVLAQAYKEGHYGQSLTSLLNERTLSQDIMDAIRFSIIKHRKGKSRW